MSRADLIRDHSGLTRPPVLTAAVLAVTATVNVIQFIVPGTLHALQRRPVGLHGQWWRVFTSLLVQDGGVAGTLSNLGFLVAVGVVAEQVVSRPRWLTAYLVGGLVGQAFGYLWQPVGGGNSVAICGLAGTVAIACWQRDPRLPRWAAPVLLLWFGAVLATWFYRLIAVGIVAARLVPLAGRRGVPVGALTLGAGVAVSVLLCTVQNIHGAALAGGLVLAVLPRLLRPVRSLPTEGSDGVRRATSRTTGDACW